MAYGGSLEGNNYVADKTHPMLSLISLPSPPEGIKDQVSSILSSSP